MSDLSQIDCASSSLLLKDPFLSPCFPCACSFGVKTECSSLSLGFASQRQARRQPGSSAAPSQPCVVKPFRASTSPRHVICRFDRSASPMPFGLQRRPKLARANSRGMRRASIYWSEWHSSLGKRSCLPAVPLCPHPAPAECEYP